MRGSQSVSKCGSSILSWGIGPEPRLELPALDDPEAEPVSDGEAEHADGDDWIKVLHKAEATQDPLQLYVRTDRRRTGSGRRGARPRPPERRRRRSRKTPRDRVPPPTGDVDHGQLHKGRACRCSTLSRRATSA